MPRRPFISTSDDKVGWLIAHAELWEFLPVDLIDHDEDVWAPLVAIGEQMVQAGLYSAETAVVDRTIAIKGHIRRIRQQRLA